MAEICRRLDGIPLAIELAAPRIRVLAPNQIAAGLSDRFRLLTGGRRGAPARQRTLEASLEWCYGLLDDVQRLALARLSLFAGSFELDAAEAVMAEKGIDQGEVLDRVTGLVEHSLLQVVQRRGSARYRLLETIRMYARQRLSALDDPDRVRRRHLEFHVALAGRAHAGLTGGQPEPWTARLDADLDDLRAAMDWAVETKDLRALVKLTEPLVRFWFERGLSRDVHRRLQDAATGHWVAPDERVRGLLAAAALAFASGEPVDCHRSASKAVEAARAPWGPGILSLMDDAEKAVVGASLTRTAELAAEGNLAAAARAFLGFPFNDQEIAVAADVGYIEAAARYVPHLLNLLQQGMEDDEAAAVEDPAVLATISAPVLLLVGSDTKPFFTTSAQHVVLHVPNAQVREIPGAGHAAP